jgi:ubiquinone/menaquinone biosynthesis C-methylase UbiE
MTPHDHKTSGHHHPGHGDRHGARQPERFDPSRAALLDDPARFEYLPPDQLITLLDPAKGARVVDFGTGTGTYAIELARHRADVEVIALDEQPQMLEILRAKPAARELSNLKPVVTGEMALEGSAERVLAINVLHELGDDALKQLAAMLKPGGFALVIDWNADVDRPIGPPRDHVYSPAEARRRLEAVGLRPRDEKPLAYHYVLRASRS